jgi:hypothetical protein
MMYLTYSKTQERVVVGEVAHTFRGEPVVVTGIELPKHAGGTGRVYVRSMDGSGMERGLYPSVIGAEWVGRKAPPVNEEN